MFERYKELLNEIEYLREPVKEKNIFSIGGKGHYENPISDILAFFLHPREQHGFGSLFLEAIFDFLDEKKEVMELTSEPRREEVSDAGNRLDIVVEAEDWILVIENKIRHHASNPFSDYQKYVSSRYNKSKYFHVLLTINDEEAPAGWINVTYKSLFSCVEKFLGPLLITNSVNKWHIILREFILSVESEYGVETMKNERFSFSQKNYAELVELRKMLEEYLINVREVICQALSDIEEYKTAIVTTNQQNWGEHGTALRIHSKAWYGHANIVFLLTNSGLFRIQMYTDSDSMSVVESLKEFLHAHDFRHFWKEGKYYGYGYYETDDFEAALSKANLISCKLNKLYESDLVS